MSQLDYDIPTTDYFFEYCKRGGLVAGSKFHIQELIDAIESGNLDSIRSQVSLDMAKRFIAENLEEY